MWEEAVLGLGFFLISGCVVVALLRIFILKSSRDSDVKRLKPQRVQSMVIQEEENMDWVALIAEQVRRVYLDDLSEAQARGVLEGLLGRDKVQVNELTLRGLSAEVSKVSVRDEHDMLVLAARLKFSAPGSRACLAGDCPVPLAGVAKCDLPVDVTLAEPALDMHVRLTWEVNGHSRFTFCFLTPPAMSVDADVRLGRAPKTIDSPFVTKVLSQNLQKLVQSFVHPATLAWASPARFSFQAGRDEGVTPSYSPSLSAMHIDTPRGPAVRRRRTASHSDL
eukprot:Rhum_TRINITY_DN25116_c0_g1::Rhum_TRINITY_DN25116_c0_g1_i1::g.181260::m.181260